MSVNNIAKKPSSLTNAAVRDVGQITKFATKKVNNLKRKGKTMNEKLENGAHELGEKARSALDRAEHMISDGTSYAENKAKERPFITIGISLLIGMLLAKLGSNNKCN